MKLSLFELNVNLPSEYLPFLNDLLRIIVIQLVAQIMFTLYNSTEYPFLSEIFILTILFLVVGVCVYWLIIKKIVVFSTTDPLPPSSEIEDPNAILS